MHCTSSLERTGIRLKFAARYSINWNNVTDCHLYWLAGNTCCPIGEIDLKMEHERGYFHDIRLFRLHSLLIRKNIPN